MPNRLPSQPPIHTRKPANPLDVAVRANVARVTSSLAPTSIMLALADWSTQLAASPGKQMELATLASEHWMRLACYTRSALLHQTAGTPIEACIAPPPYDKRFKEPGWQRWPFNVMQQSFLLADQWWRAATTGVMGVSPHHEHMVSFLARQWLDMASPGNFPFTNPEVIERTGASVGRNLAQGALHFLEDLRRMASGQPAVGTEAFEVGKNVAITPGKVVLRNQLIELIQYAPQTPTVHREPVLVIPAWIMKYYILDLSPGNSLIKHLVDQGFTVFCISWKNPGLDERDLDMDDYLKLGFHAALDAINAIVPGEKIHATGYCLGGTLLAIAAAAMARDGDDRLASLSLFTAQTDFREAGELALFIDEGEVSLLESQMEQTGYLTAGQMAGAFQMLRSNDLMWSRMINEYLIGERSTMTDLMAWNADATRMPARMHGRYLRELFLNNALAEGRYRVGGEPITLFNVKTPIFCVATVADHVAPWGSVYKLHYLTPAEITFVLTSGGHNAGIVSPPSRTDRSYQMLTREHDGHYLSHKLWLETAKQLSGSWWPQWFDWLAQQSGPLVTPPSLGNAAAGYAALDDAPGIYVHER